MTRLPRRSRLAGRPKALTVRVRPEAAHSRRIKTSTWWTTQLRERRGRIAAAPRSWNGRLLCGGRKSRQLADVAQVVLDDHGRVEVRGDLLHPLDRRDRLRAVVIEGRHAVRFVVLVEVRGVAAQQEHVSRLDDDPQADAPSTLLRP